MPVPEREVGPPPRKARVLDATSQPVEARVGEQVTERDAEEEARAEARKIGRSLLVMSAQPGAPQPQHRVGRYDEPVGECHAVVADAVVPDREAVDADGFDEQDPERPAPRSPEVAAAHK